MKNSPLKLKIQRESEIKKKGALEKNPTKALAVEEEAGNTLNEKTRKMIRSQAMTVQPTSVAGLIKTNGCEFVNSSIEGIFDSAKPKTAIEEMLLAQLASIHHLVMQSYINAAPKENADSFEKWIKHALKLQKAFVSVVNCLQKEQNENRTQTIRVEKVDISGGQNIVGGISRGE